MDLQNIPFAAGKTRIHRQKANQKPIPGARNNNLKQPPIRSQKRVFGTSRTNILARPEAEKFVGKQPAGPKKPSDPPKGAPSSVEFEKYPKTKGGEVKFPGKTVAEIPSGEKILENVADDARLNNGKIGDKWADEGIEAVEKKLAEALEKKSPVKEKGPISATSDAESPGEEVVSGSKKSGSRLGSTATRKMKAAAENNPVEASEVESSVKKGRAIISKTSSEKPKTVLELEKGRTAIDDGKSEKIEAVVENIPVPKLEKRTLVNKSKGKISKTPPKVPQNHIKSSRKECPEPTSTPPQSSSLRKPRETPFQSAKQCSKCRFDRLETASYWLAQIKLAEMGEKHFVSAAFFRLALESKAEPSRNVRVELRRYLSRHRNLSGESEWRDIWIGYGLPEDEENAVVVGKGTQNQWQRD